MKKHFKMLDRVFLKIQEWFCIFVCSCLDSQLSHQSSLPFVNHLFNLSKHQGSLLKIYSELANLKSKSIGKYKHNHFLLMLPSGSKVSTEKPSGFEKVASQILVDLEYKF